MCRYMATLAISDTLLLGDAIWLWFRSGKNEAVRFHDIIHRKNNLLNLGNISISHNTVQFVQFDNNVKKITLGGRFLHWNIGTYIVCTLHQVDLVVLRTSTVQCCIRRHRTVCTMWPNIVLIVRYCSIGLLDCTVTIIRKCMNHMQNIYQQYIIEPTFWHGETRVLSPGGGALPRFFYTGVPLRDLEPHPSIRRSSAKILTLF